MRRDWINGYDKEDRSFHKEFSSFCGILPRFLVWGTSPVRCRNGSRAKRREMTGQSFWRFLERETPVLFLWTGGVDKGEK